MFRLILTALCALVLPLFANDPGGGAPGVGANVTLTSNSTTVTLSNGVITAVIQKSSGKVSSYLFNGTQMVDPSNPIYYSMDGGANYEQPTNCVYSVTTQTADMVDVSFKRTWNSTSGYKHVFDIELHYVLRRGDTGLYAYAILDHPASYPAATVGEWRIVWKLPRTSTTFHFERAYIDDLRNWEMPSYYDYQNASPTSIGEIVKLNTGVMAGEYDGKYSYAARYYDIGTWGHTSSISKKGVWFALGGHDYFNDGPTHQDLTSSESYILMHFGRNHFGGSGTSVAAGEAWRKMYGPFLLYCNGTTATSNPGDVLWADAKAQVEAEKAAWPYSWLVNADHPAASGRGTVTGRLMIQDSLKPAITGANAMVGLAAPQGTHGNWQQQSKGYQYWVKADASGNFTIPAVRPGTYTLYAFTEGVVEEFSKTDIVVTAGATNTQGDINWNIFHPGTSIAWEIGVPDRTAKEFKHGQDYFTPFLWDVYTNELPNPLVYNVGTSNPATDWNYVHSNYKGATPGTTTGWNWDVNFNLPAVPRSGNATLTVAFAGAHYARLFLYLNGETTAFTRLSPTISGGNALLRQGIHAKYSYVDVSIPVSRLKQGSNTFRFAYGGDPGYSSHVMYDYLRLELPDFPPPPPDSGRSIVWSGGSSAASNTWDLGATSAFNLDSQPVTFGTGDSVTFDASGSNATAISLVGTLQPNSVTFSGTKNYNLSGTGDLSGPMSLFKSGSSTLTISQANTYSGITSISGGVVSLANDIANGSGLGTSDVVLQNATLRMFSNGATNSSVSSYWNIDVPGGFTGTLESDSRCELRGKLTGNGTFNYRLPSGSVRSSIFGDWSAFSGTIEASAISGSAEFRMAPDYNWPGLPSAALSLGNNITAQWGGNLNSGNGTFISIGELAGTSSSTLKGGSIGGRQITYRIGARGGDATFAGTISEQTNGITNLVKQGLGTWTLSGIASINGNIVVEAGILDLTGTTNQIAGKSTTVSNAATLNLDGTLNAETLAVSSGGTLSGQGSLVGNLLNEGWVEMDGGTFDIQGNAINQGYFRVKAPATFSITGTFDNQGVLNLIGSTQALPPGITNSGLILMDRAPATITWTGNDGPLWDLHTTVSWLSGPSQPAVFFTDDAVVFDDSATTFEVELAADLNPSSVTVNTNLEYAFSGGGLVGPCNFLKTGSGSLTVGSSLALTGSVTVSAGSLNLSYPLAWPTSAPLIDIHSSAVLSVVALSGQATVGPAQTLRGSGMVNGDLTVEGIHEPGPGASVTGSLDYVASARVLWSLASDSEAVGQYDSISADDITIASGAVLNLAFNEPAGTVNFSTPFWSAPRSWNLLSTNNRTGVFSLGTITADSFGNAPGSYGIFTITGSGTNLVLNWNPIPVVARWRGGVSGDWDFTTPNWDKNGIISNYQNGIATVIDDNTSITAITLEETIEPGSFEFDSTKDFQIGGAFPISGSTSLEKKGEGTLTLTSANTYSGGTTIHSGRIVISHSAALGSGTVTLSGGRWDTGTLAPANAIVVAGDSTIGGGSGNGSHGIKAVTGSGLLTLDAGSVFDLEGSMSGFNGTVQLIGSGSFRFNGSNGSSSASFDLGNRSLAARNGGTYQVGSLTGAAGSALSIATYTGAVTFSIGGNNLSTTHAGNISNGSGVIHLSKTGSGTLTLAGTASHTGNTIVNAGRMKVTGSLQNTSLTVNSGAEFESAGTVSIPALTLQPSASLLVAVSPQMSPLQVNGNVALNGSFQPLLAPGMSFGRFPVIAHSGTRTGSISLTGLPETVPAHLSYQANQVVLYLDDSDEDGLPDSWEQAHFEGLDQSASNDADGDGSTNLVEFRLGLDPTSPTSSFHVWYEGSALVWPSVQGLVFTIQRNTSLAANDWEPIGTVTAGSGSTATFTDNQALTRAFYRISFDP